MNVTQHRINEIFANIKKGKDDEENLNEAEFEEALNYFQIKNT